MSKYQKVAMYQTGDGKVFTTQKEATQHTNDSICEMYDNIIKPLNLPNLKYSDKIAIIEALLKESENIQNYLNYMDMIE